MAQNQNHDPVIVEFLTRLVEAHEEHSHEYHLAIRSFLSSLPLSKDLLLANLHVRELNAMARDTEQEASVRSAALATSLAFLWRRRDYQQFRKVFDDYRSIFQEYDSSLESLYKGMYDLSKVSSPGGFKQALESAKRAKEELPNTPGALNLYTEVVAVIGERGDVKEEELEQARVSIEKAIEKDITYAKYYASRARILALQGRYDDSYQDIDKAIEIENFDEHTLWRVNYYEEIRINVRLQQRSMEIRQQISEMKEIRQQADEMKQEQERTRKQMAAMRGETLTLLGLLAAVIAFVVSSVQLMSNLQSVETGILMTIMAGLLLVVFGAFMELIQPGERWRRKSKWVVRIGVVMVILAGLGLWLGLWFEVLPGLND